MRQKCFVSYSRRLSDLVGADIGLHVGKNFMEEKPDQFYPALVFKLMVDAGLLGEKSPSGGFYTFEKNKCGLAWCHTVLECSPQPELPKQPMRTARRPDSA